MNLVLKLTIRPGGDMKTVYDDSTGPLGTGLLFDDAPDGTAGNLLFEDASIIMFDQIEIGGDGIVKGDGWSLNLKSVSEHMAMCEVLKTQKEGINMQYMTIGGTLFVVIVCIITVKWIIPRLTISNIVKGFVRLLYWPFRRFGRVVCDAWKKRP